MGFSYRWFIQRGLNELCYVGDDFVVAACGHFAPVEDEVVVEGCGVAGDADGGSLVFGFFGAAFCSSGEESGPWGVVFLDGVASDFVDGCEDVV